MVKNWPLRAVSQLREAARISQDRKGKPLVRSDSWAMMSSELRPSDQPEKRLISCGLGRIDLKEKLMHPEKALLPPAPRDAGFARQTEQSRAMVWILQRMGRLESFAAHASTEDG